MRYASIRKNQIARKMISEKSTNKQNTWYKTPNTIYTYTAQNLFGFFHPKHVQVFQNYALRTFVFPFVICFLKLINTWKFLKKKDI